MSITAFRGYPQSDGGKIEWVGRVSGVNYTAGTPQTLYARSFGMKNIEQISAGMSESKTYFVEGTSQAGPKTSSGIHWFASSSGAEATADLSAEYVTLRVIGS